MSVAETSVAETFIDETSVDEMSVDETSVDKTGVDKMSKYLFYNLLDPQIQNLPKLIGPSTLDF